LRSDPSERGQEGIGYNEWWYRHSFYAIPTQRIVGSFLASFAEFPPRQKPGSFTVDKAVDALRKSSVGNQ
jgi:arylsulfatase